jgi:DinB superfamily
MDLRTDRVGLLLDQLAASVETSRDRFEGLTDDEYLWEPAQPAWSVRRRGEARAAGAFGSGDWVIDHDRDPDPPPLTTIAWRITHLLGMYEGRWHWTLGPRTIDPKDLLVPTPVARQALDQLWAQTDRWLTDAGTLTDEQLDTVGFGQYPYGLDPQLPFIAILWWMNREFIHHAAEIALLRDLYRARGGEPL